MAITPFSISTLVDIVPDRVLLSGYNAFSISTLVDDYEDSGMPSLAITPFQFLLL